MTAARADRARYRDTLLTLTFLAAIAALYWPAARGGFVWDDKLCFHDAAWLRYGDEWTHYLFRDFCQWVNYFRPLVVALLTLEVRLFDVDPGAMHVVSIGMHIANTLLVGVLARRLVAGEAAARDRIGAVYAAMILYGLHPALVEPVVWIGCQFDLAATFFLLLALLANTLALRQDWLRAATVAAAFFLAACSKESAAALPPLLVVIDLVVNVPAGTEWRTRLRATVHRQWRVYVGLLVAGAAYLLLRGWALGALVKPLGTTAFFSLQHFQEVCRVYLAYLRVIVWPFAGLGPIHIQAPSEFAALSVSSLCVDVAAIGIAAVAVIAFVRAKPIGYLIVAISAALLPVLHLVPVAYDASLYHERYAMIALAALSALLPLALARTTPRWREPLTGRPVMAGLAAWTVFAALTVRTTVPLWSNDVTLWQWAARTNPDSIVAMDHLLTAYMNVNDHANAHVVAQAIVDSGQPCASCLLNAANLAIAERDIAAAKAALDVIGSDRQFLYDGELLRQYIFAQGQILELQGNLADAELAYRESMRMEPLDPIVKHSLALLLLRQGKRDEAGTVEQAALALFAPAERAAHRHEFDALRAGNSRQP